MVAASKVLRPNSVYALAVTLLKSASPCSISASITRDGTEIASVVKFYEPGDIESLLLKVTFLISKYFFVIDKTNTVTRFDCTVQPVFSAITVYLVQNRRKTNNRKHSHF